MPEAKLLHTICVLGGMVYVMGGISAHNTDVSSVFCFDPAANSWITVAPMLTTRWAPGSFVLGGSIHVAGGAVGGRDVSSVERYCAATNSWALVNDMELSQARQIYSAVSMEPEVDFFDCLADKATRSRR